MVEKLGIAEVRSAALLAHMFHTATALPLLG